MDRKDGWTVILVCKAQSAFRDIEGESPLREMKRSVIEPALRTGIIYIGK